MQFQTIVKKNQEILKKQLNRFISDEEYLIFLVRIFKDVSCKNPTSIDDRIYDFFQLYYPELALKISKEKLAILIYNTKSFERDKLSNRWVSSDSIGMNLHDKQIIFLNNLLRYFNPKLKWKLKFLNETINELKKEISELVSQLVPKVSNFLKDDILCALLIERASGIKKLAFKSSNYIQLLGAENSFFGDYKPKHGLIYNHKKIQLSENKGKSARNLANQISLLFKEDYFK